jgi:hypothetical protein
MKVDIKLGEEKREKYPAETGMLFEFIDSDKRRSLRWITMLALSIVKRIYEQNETGFMHTNATRTSDSRISPKAKGFC